MSILSANIMTGGFTIEIVDTGKIKIIFFDIALGNQGYVFAENL